MDLGVHADQHHHPHVSLKAHHIDGQEYQGESDTHVPVICDAQKVEFQQGPPGPGEVLWPHPEEQKVRREKAKGGKGKVMTTMGEKALCPDIRTWVLVLFGNKTAV